MIKGKLHKTDNGWVVMFNKKLEHQMVGYHDYKTTTVYDQLPLHPDDVNQINEDSQVFDNIESRIATWPDVNFEIVSVYVEPSTSIHSNRGDDVTYAKLIPNNENKLSRVEVIDEKGRSYVKYFDGECELSYQDEGRTLKIFITPNKK
jgi:hypothetical protein